MLTRRVLRDAEMMSGGAYESPFLPAFDYVAALRQADPEMLDIVTDAFLDRYPEEVNKLRAGCAAGDATALLFVAHALRSSLVLFHARPAEELARQIEHFAAKGKCSEADPLVA